MTCPDSTTAVSDAEPGWMNALPQVPVSLITDMEPQQQPRIRTQVTVLTAAAAAKVFTTFVHLCQAET